MATKIGLITQVARNLGDLILDGVPASLTGSSIDNLSLVHRNAENLTGKYCFIYSGGGAGQDRVIGSFAPANKRLIFDQAFSPVPSTNSNFIITGVFPKADYDMRFLISSASLKIDFYSRL